MEGWCLHEGLPFYLSDPGSLQEQSYSNGEGLGKKFRVVDKMRITFALSFQVVLFHSETLLNK